MSAAITGSFCLPVFLTPAFGTIRIAPCSIAVSRSFSSTASNKKQNKKNVNKKRGVSALRSTGPKTKLSIDRYPLPQPVRNPAALRAEFPINENHGLYKFFNANKDPLISPAEEESHGRSWSHSELEKKSFDDLWKLHWQCVREANQVATRNNERRRVYAGYGEQEGEARMSTTAPVDVPVVQNHTSIVRSCLSQIKATMRRIRQVLTRRHDDRTNALALLNIKNLNELFPNAESELNLGVSKSQPELETIITEVHETSVSAEDRQDPGATQGETKDGEDASLEQPRDRRKQRLTE